jgi:hypothetical protein
MLDVPAGSSRKFGLPGSAANFTPGSAVAEFESHSPEEQVTRLRPAAQTLLALLLMSSCAPQEPAGTERAVDNEPSTSTGITTFGDARLGVVFD